MTLREFNYLSTDRKREAVLFNGVFLVARETSCLVMLLYQVDGFYIEVVALKSEQAILKVQAFENTDLLEPYLVEMDITEAIEQG